MESRESMFSIEGVTASKRILHTPSAFARNNLMYVQEVGKLKSLQPHVCIREKIDSFLIFVVLSGEGKLTTKNDEYYIKKNDCIFLDCNERYEHVSSVNNPWELMWVHFYGGNVGAYHELFLKKNEGQPVFCPQNIGDIKECIEEMISISDEKDINTELNFSLILTKLLTYCASTMKGKAYLETIRKFIDNNFGEEALLELLGEKFNGNINELNSNFYKNYGIELQNYIMVRRFTAAKEMLRFTIKDIKEIIRESGIKDEKLFAQLFLENEGMTAEEYRMKWAQWIKA